LRHHGRVGLTGIVTCLKLQLAATPVNFDSMDIKHVGSFVFAFSVRSDLLTGLMPGEHLLRRHRNGADGSLLSGLCACGHAIGPVLNANDFAA
jgi:hypothetical protein